MLERNRTLLRSSHTIYLRDCLPFLQILLLFPIRYDRQIRNYAPRDKKASDNYSKNTRFLRFPDFKDKALT